MQFRGRARLGPACLEQHAAPSPSSFNSFFPFQWLPAWRVGWEKRKRRKRAAKTAGSEHLTGGCRHPHPVVCRLGSGALGQSAPSAPFTSGCAGFGSEGAPFHHDPLWRKYNVSGKKRIFTAGPSVEDHNGALNPLTTHQRDKIEQRIKNVWSVGLSADYFPWFFLLLSKQSSPAFGSWHSTWRSYNRQNQIKCVMEKKQKLLCVAWHATTQMIPSSEIEFLSERLRIANKLTHMQQCVLIWKGFLFFFFYKGDIF